MTTKTIEKVIIIGSGPAGYTAAIYAARAMLCPILISGFQEGGQLTITTDVENYPGFADVIQGPWLMEQMKQQAIQAGTRIIATHIESVDFTNSPFCLRDQDGTSYYSHSVIIATGAQAQWLGVPGEDEFRGFGVSACAVCDGFFFKNKHVAVVGGGNTALEEALHLTHFARKVTIIHRRDCFRGEKVLQKRVLNHPQISVLWNQQVAEIMGDKKPAQLRAVKMLHTLTQKEETFDIDGLFIAIGHKPATQIFDGILERDTHGYIHVKPGTTQTSIEGIYAAGDVCDKIYRQAVTAAGLGCMAALEAEKFLTHTTNV